MVPRFSSPEENAWPFVIPLVSGAGLAIAAPETTAARRPMTAVDISIFILFGGLLSFEGSTGKLAWTVSKTMMIVNFLESLRCC